MESFTRTKVEAERWLDQLKATRGLDSATELPRKGRILYISCPYFGGWKVEKISANAFVITSL